ncbi:MAG TPA: hypothetical protein PK668_10305 [Myxococcota bacterium]|nr:hypothetical protein [Myxococcota bacterium]HRY93441.1 hypothetical protein [Myxococcota bacterium]HSA21004.1 hypothetical protein [Myxococcota bacterium]
MGLARHTLTCLLGCLACQAAARAEQPPAGEASAWGFELSLRLSQRFAWKENFLNPLGSLTAAGRQLMGGGGAGSGALYEGPLNLRLEQDELGYSLFAGARLAVRYEDTASLALALDSGELKFPALSRYSPAPLCRLGDPRCGATSNGQAALDEAAETGFVRELYLALHLGQGGWLDVRLGKFLASAAAGFVLDNHALGVALDADLELGFDLPARVALDALLPDGRFVQEGKRSPFVHLEAAYLLSFLEELGLLFAWYHDGDSSLASIMYAVLSEAALAGGLPTRPLYLALQDPATRISTRGNLFWVGARGRLVFDGWSLGALGVLEVGGFELTVEGQTPTGEPVSRGGRADCLGGLLDLDLQVDVTDSFGLGAFFLFQSGETFGPDELREGLAGRYTSFLAVYPYVTRMNLFFSGGLNENFSARTFSTSGVNGRGVLAPGLSAGWDIHASLNLVMRSALLFSQGAHLMSGSRFYGWETDLELRWTPLDWLRVSLEADYLLSGGFFDFSKPIEELQASARTYTREPDLWKILIGLDLLY